MTADAQVEEACANLRLILTGAENANHDGEILALRTVAAMHACHDIPTAQLQPGSVLKLVESLKGVLEYEDVKPPRPDTPRWRAYTKAYAILASFKEENND